MTTRRVYRTDIGTLRPVERRADGTIRVDAHLTRTGVFQYRQPDGSIRNELRLPEDVFDPTSLESFLGVPVTNDHPPDMITARNARQYAVGSQLGAITRDDDHVRSRLSVFDDDTVSAMNAGKTQISCGYTCDCVETPGVHPLYGPYDAIQKNIRGNHIAIVDRGRAGITAAARMDGWMVVAPDAGTARASSPLRTKQDPCHVRGAMKNAPARADGSASEVIDPDDEANRNAAGKNNAHDAGGDRAAAVDPGKPGKPAKPADPDDDEPTDEPADDEAMYDDDGDLTDAGHRKIAAASFALPDKQKLPIHDPSAVKDSMKRFGDHEFDSADEKHGAFNRLVSKGKQFGMDTGRFEKKHSGKLDRADSALKDITMTPTEIKALQEKADKRKVKLVEAKTKCDSLEQENEALKAAASKLEGEKASLAKDLETAKASRGDAADAETVQKRIDAKIDLLDQARKTGATVTSKMSDLEIMRTVIKHVDKEDVPADKVNVAPYVEALYVGAIKRATKDAAETQAGANALAAARGTVVPPVVNPQNKSDADEDTDEEAAARRLRADSATSWRKQENK